MGYLDNIESDFQSKKFAQVGCLGILIAFFSFVVYIIIDNSNDYDSIFILAIIISILVIITLIINSFKIHLKKNEIDALKIIIAFQKEMNYSNDEIRLYILDKFSIFQRKDIDKKIKMYLNKDISVNKICKRISTKPSDIKYFIIGLLLDAASNDLLLSIEEENYINNIRTLLKVHSKTYNYIKSNYLKQGLKRRTQNT